MKRWIFIMLRFYPLYPAYLAILLRMWEAELKRFNAQLKCVRLGSGAASKRDLERLAEILPNVDVCICYGSSEASDCAYYRYKGHPEKIGCVGIVNKNARIRLLDEDGGEIAAPDIPGRIELSGSNSDVRLLSEMRSLPEAY